jgi:hypothetical protein
LGTRNVGLRVDLYEYVHWLLELPQFFNRLFGD